MHRGAVQEVHRAVIRLAHLGLEATDLCARAIGALQSVVQIDGWCRLIKDSATVLSTGGRTKVAEFDPVNGWLRGARDTEAELCCARAVRRRPA